MRRFWKWLIGCLVIISVVAYVGWRSSVFVTIIYIIDKERYGQNRVICVEHMRTVVGAILDYSAAHGGRLPPAKNWCDLLIPYVKDRSVFTCPEARNKTCSYALNNAIAGRRLADLGDPTWAVVLFESDAGWNAAGGPDLLPPNPRHRQGDHLGFADGHSSWRSRKRGKTDYGEQWLKEYLGESIEWSPDIHTRRREP